jgi:hypothetical protein
MTFDDAVEILNPGAAPPAPAAAAPPPSVAAHPAPSRQVDLWSDTVDDASPPQDSPPASRSVERANLEKQLAAAASLPDTVDAGTSREFPAPPEEAAGGDQPPPPLLPGDQWISPQAQVWRQWVLFGGSAAMGIALAVAVFGYAVIHATKSRRGAVANVPQADAPVKPTVTTGPDATQDPPPSEPEDSQSPAAAETEESPALPAESNPPAAAQPDGADEEESKPSAESAEANPPAPPGESPFETSPAPAPTDVASNGDLLDQFGDFLGAGSVATPPEPTAPTADVEGAPSDADSASASDESPPEETPLPRPPLRRVEVAARLADPIVEIEFASVPLAEFLEFISDLSTIPITIEPEALAWRKLSPTSAVSVREKETTVEGVLNAALAPLNLGFIIEDGHLLVTGSAARDARMRTISHPVDDLTGGDSARRKELGEQIVRLVAPESWKTAGGEGTLEAMEGGLSITQTEAVHFRVIAFCETLRLSRGMAQRTRFDAALFEPQAQRKTAREKLATPVTLNYRHPTELTTILAAFGKTAGVSILIDWRAAADAGWPPDAKGSVVADGGPLSDALARLLSPMDLAYRVVDGSTIQIITPETLRTRLETTFYPVSDLVDGKPGEAALLERIKNDLGEHFAAGRGDYHLDPAGKHLIAALPQPQHDQLASLLDALRKE